MAKFKRLLFICLFISGSMTAQLDSHWQKNWQNTNQVHCMAHNQEGKIFVVGNTKNGDKQKLRLAILDESGSFLTDTLVKTAYTYPEAHTILATKDNGLLIAGTSGQTQKGKRTGWLAKTDNTGKMLWERQFLSQHDVVFTSIIADTQGEGYYLGGTNGADFWILKANQAGEEIQKQKIEQIVGKNPQLSTLLLSSDGKHLFAVGSERRGTNHTEGVIFCWNTDGTSRPRVLGGEGGKLDWKKTYPNTQLNAAVLDEKKEALLVTGSAWNAQTFDDMLVLLVDPTDGTVRGRQSIPLDGSDLVTSMLPKQDGYYLIGNSTSQERGQRFEDICLMAIDASGNPEWAKPLYYGGTNADKTLGSTLLPDNSLIILGQTGQNNWIARFNTAEKINQKPQTSLEAIWDTPQYNLLNKGVVTVETHVLPIRLKVLSPVKLDASHFKILMADNSVRIASLAQPKVYSDSVYTYYETTVYLQEGENQVSVQISCFNTVFKTKTLTVRYDPRPNLYIVALGIKARDLHYTEKDATDFAAFFQNSHSTDNELFKSTTVLLKNDSASTTFTSIVSTFKHLESDFGKIRPKDVLIVFASSHGQADIIKKQYYIHASNTPFDWREGNIINYDTHILNPIKSINCKKIMLIDACESGQSGTKSVNKTILIDFLKEEPDTWYMASSMGESFEDPKWENGAFTESVLQAFKTTKADKNQDKFLSFDELFAYVSAHLPKIVAEQKDNKEQRPTKNKSGNFPIFKIRK